MEIKYSYGMENITIEKTDNMTYAVYADTKRFGKHEMMFESYRLSECKEWLIKNSNVLKAVDAAKKTEGFRKFTYRVFCYTSDSEAYRTKILLTDKGVYVMFDGCRSNYRIFVDTNFKVIRKPKKIKGIEIKIRYNRYA